MSHDSGQIQQKIISHLLPFSEKEKGRNISRQHWLSPLTLPLAVRGEGHVRATESVVNHAAFIKRQMRQSYTQVGTSSSQWDHPLLCQDLQGQARLQVWTFCNQSLGSSSSLSRSTRPSWDTNMDLLQSVILFFVKSHKTNGAVTLWSWHHIKKPSTLLAMGCYQGREGHCINNRQTPLNLEDIFYMVSGKQSWFKNESHIYHAITYTLSQDSLKKMVPQATRGDHHQVLGQGLGAINATSAPVSLCPSTLPQHPTKSRRAFLPWLTGFNFLWCKKRRDSDQK